jgi:hypothetical protein
VKTGRWLHQLMNMQKKHLWLKTEMVMLGCAKLAE